MYENSQSQTMSIRTGGGSQKNTAITFVRENVDNAGQPLGKM